MKQMGTAVQLYAGDYDGLMPSATKPNYFFLNGSIGDYVQIHPNLWISRVGTVFWCPAETRQIIDDGMISRTNFAALICRYGTNYSYIYDYNRGFEDSFYCLNKVRNPSEKFIIADGVGYYGRWRVSAIYIRNFGSLTSYGQFVSDDRRYTLFARHNRLFNAASVDGHAEMMNNIEAYDPEQRYMMFSPYDESF